MNFEVFRDPPQPLEVIRDPSKSGSERARALSCLREPLASGGSQKEQDVVIAVLNHSAAHESQAWCRVAAISSLRKFKDPRAYEGLKEAYYRAGSFSPQTASMIRCQVLTAMGEMGNAAAVELLVRVLREPPVEGPDADQEFKLNERCAATRALGNFKQYQATAALVEALRTEQEVQMRNRVHEALVAATGKDVGLDAQSWADFLNNPQSMQPPNGNSGAGSGIRLTGTK